MENANFRVPPKESDCFPTEARYYTGQSELPPHLAGYEAPKTSRPKKVSAPELPPHMRGYKYGK